MLGRTNNFQFMNASSQNVSQLFLEMPIVSFVYWKGMNIYSFQLVKQHIWNPLWNIYIEAFI